MKSYKLIMAVIFAVTAYASATTPATQPIEGNYVPGELIVKLEHGIIDFPGFDETPIEQISVLSPQFATLLQQYEVRSVERVFKSIFATPPFKFVTKRGREVYFKDLSQVYLLRMDKDLDMEQVAEQVEDLSGVIYANPNYYFSLHATPPNDLDFEYEAGDESWEYQWGMHNRYTGQPGWDVNVLRAWSTETGDNDVKVAILDSGLELVHYDESGDEFWGRIYDKKDWTGQGNDCDDTIGHGTHVTGILAAATNSGAGQGGDHGVAGGAGGWNGERGVELLIAKIARARDYMPVVDILHSIEWATEKGADVLNGSFGSSSYIGDDVREAIENAFMADMTLFFASGNLNTYVDCPARFAEYDICCAVGNMTPQGTRHPTSNWGSPLSFVAPGTHVFSTYEYENNVCYDTASGTSMASPHAAGVGALLYSAGGSNLWDVDCKRILEHTARHNDDVYGSVEWDPETGYGCVDAWEALRHFYWPYVMQHGTSSNYQSSLDASDVLVNFIASPNPNLPAGRYKCDRYRVEITASFSDAYDPRITPWAWGRILDGAPGYNNSTTNPAWPWVKTVSEAYNNAKFETYVYWIKYNAIGQVINQWGPRAPQDVQIAYTAIGEDATKTIHSPPIPSSNYGMDSDLAVDFVHPDVPNTVHISYYDVDNGDLRYIVDNFSGFSSSEIVHSEGDVGQWSSIALDPDGYPHIGYYDATNENPKHAWKDTQGWHTEPIYPLCGGGSCTSIAVDKNTGLVQACFCLGDTSAVPYYNFMYAYRDGAPPYNWTAEVVDAVAWWCSLALGPDGTPHVSYYDSLSGNLKYAVRIQGTWDTVTVDNTASRVGLYTDIAIDQEGNPHISYYDAPGPGGLKYAYKPEAGNWQFEGVPGTANGGKWSSICIDDDGRPIIVYQQSGFYGVRCAKKTSTGWQIKIIESGETLGNYGTSVAIDNLGRMVSTHYDETNGRLRVAWRARWPQESGYGTMMAGNNAGVAEELRPSIPMGPEITDIIPNPTTGSATIRYQLPYAADTRIAVYDVAGQLVTTLVWGEQQAGEHEVRWKGQDNIGREASSGVYFVRMETENYQSNKKLTLLR